MKVRSLSVLGFIHFIVWIQKFINDPDWPIDFLLGGAKYFQLGRGMHSPSSCLLCTSNVPGRFETLAIIGSKTAWPTQISE